MGQAEGHIPQQGVNIRGEVSSRSYDKGLGPWTDALLSLDLRGMPTYSAVAMDRGLVWIVRSDRPSDERFKAWPTAWGPALAVRSGRDSRTKLPEVPLGASREERLEVLANTVRKALQRAGLASVRVSIR